MFFTDRFPPVENILAKELELNALDLGAIVRPATR